MLILIFHSFGEQIAGWIGMAFFAAAFIFWLVRFILYCKNYGRVTVEIARNVFKQRSLSKGISRFITEEYPLVTWTYAGSSHRSNCMLTSWESPFFNSDVFEKPARS